MSDSCDTTDCNLPGFSVHGFLQARILEWVDISLSRQEYWSGLTFPSPGDLPNLEIEPRSPALQVDSLPAEPQWLLFQSGPGRNHPPVALCLQVRKLHSLPPLTKQRKPSHLFQKVYDDCTFWLFFSLATGYREMRKKQKR